MADDDEIKWVWYQDGEGILRGFHLMCAVWLNLDPKEGDSARTPYHTEVCRGCGRFLDAKAPDKDQPPPPGVDGRMVL